jgi:carbon monoxide dehydrogenase subunit G
VPPRERVVERHLPVAPEALWNVLSDTGRMLDLDPLLVSYEPETGEVKEGTLNRATSRIGPIRMTMTTRTEVLAPPTRAVFVSVRPSRPAVVRVEDTLIAADGGTVYRITISAKPVGLLGIIAAPLLVRMMARSRRQLLDRLAAQLAAR